MSVYMIFIRESEVRDPEEMAKYKSSPRPAEMKGKPLVVYGDMKTVEGEAADGVVIMEFPDRESAESWYYSEEYQAAAKHRMAAADYRAMIVEGWTPPQG